VGDGLSWQDGLKGRLRPARRAAIAAAQLVLGALWAGYHRHRPMRVVMTLLVRDEADIVAATIEHALAIGVDLIVATDNGSTDETPRILADYAAAGVLELHHEPRHTYEQGRWVTAMARRAARLHGASWVVNLDGDEFLWPASLDLKAALGSCEPAAGLFPIGEWRLSPDPGRTGGWAQRVVAGYPGSTWSGSGFWKVCHRADPHVRVLQGNHYAFGPRLGGVSRRQPLLAMHLPDRSPAQYLHKLELANAAFSAHPRARSSLGLGVRREYELVRKGEFAANYRGWEARITGLLADGSATIDTRLHDRLHALLPRALLPHRLAEALRR
jgi:hypothetical protein